MGYQPHIRVTPAAGPTIDFDLESFDRLSVQKLFVEPEFTTKTTVRRRLRNVMYGWRLRAIFEWVITPGSLSEANPDSENATSGIIVLWRYLVRKDSTLALNMNGGGVPYRDCALIDATRGFVEDKHVFALYHLELACIDLISEDSLPPEVAQSPGGLLRWYGLV